MDLNVQEIAIHDVQEIQIPVQQQIVEQVIEQFPINEQPKIPMINLQQITASSEDAVQATLCDSGNVI